VLFFLFRELTTFIFVAPLRGGSKKLEINAQVNVFLGDSITGWKFKDLIIHKKIRNQENN
jgi:hypothetical protein